MNYVSPFVTENHAVALLHLVHRYYSEKMAQTRMWSSTEKSRFGDKRHLIVAALFLKKYLFWGRNKRHLRGSGLAVFPW